MITLGTIVPGVLDPVITMTLGGFGECLARWDNYVEVDRNMVDCYGIPVLRIHMKFRENEHAIIDDMAASGAEMLESGFCNTTS